MEDHAKTSEDFQSLPEDFKRFSKISPDVFRRLPKIAKDYPCQDVHCSCKGVARGGS